MISRYSRAEMSDLWTGGARWHFVMQVEVAVAEVQAQLGIIPKAAAQDIAQKAKFNVDEINEIEKQTKHDVIAFVTNAAQYIGENGRFLHYGLTSSDVLDTALGLQIKKASEVLLSSVARWDKALLKLIADHHDTVCAGRTHGMHGEPTTFGFKMAGFLTELRRNRERLVRATTQLQIGKLSGAVGTYSALPPEVEKLVCEKLGLKPESVATQVIPRDRHAELAWSIAMLGTAMERLAVELRHLQRTEVSEVNEGFSAGQKGSSAMPHKRNPISAENLTGAARMLRAYLSAALENVALWHERDISHSSVERVFLSDAFILADYASDRMGQLLENLQVDKVRMQKNLAASSGQIYSSHLLLALVQSGLSREDAYALVQKLSHSLQDGESLGELAARHAEIKKHVNDKKLQEIFSGQAHLKTIGSVVGRVLAEGSK